MFGYKVMSEKWVVLCEMNLQLPLREKCRWLNNVTVVISVVLVLPAKASVVIFVPAMFFNTRCGKVQDCLKVKPREWKHFIILQHAFHYRTLNRTVYWVPVCSRDFCSRRHELQPKQFYTFTVQLFRSTLVQISNSESNIKFMCKCNILPLHSFVVYSRESRSYKYIIHGKGMMTRRKK